MYIVYAFLPMLLLSDTVEASNKENVPSSGPFAILVPNINDVI